MIFTAKMKFLTTIVLAKHKDIITKKLLELGLLHFVKLTELRSGLGRKVANVAIPVDSNVCLELRRRLESYLSMIKCNPNVEHGISLSKFEMLDLERETKKLDELASAIQNIRERQRVLQHEILKLEDIARQLDLFGDVKNTLKARSQFSFLSFHIGLVKSELVSELKKEIDSYPSVAINFQEINAETYLLIINLKRDDHLIHAVLERYAFSEIEIKDELESVKKEEIMASLDKKKNSLLQEQANLAQRSSDLIIEKKAELLELWEKLRLQELYVKLNSYFNQTAHTIIFSGWLPASKSKLVEEALAQVTEGHYYAEWREPTGVEEELDHKIKVPVKLQNPKALSPFQMLVTNYSIPEYGTVDPTPIVAVLYLTMFGLMFADVGQGLVIMLLGLTGPFWAKRFKEGPRQLVKLFSFCGLAAILGGVLFGSYFGFELFPPLWFSLHSLIAGHAPAASPVKNILQVLVITLYFGIGIILLGLLLNWINQLKKQKWFNLIFDRTGIIGGWIYLGGIYTAYTFINSGFKSLPDQLELLFWLALPALLLIGKPITEFFEHAKHTHARFSFTTIFKFIIEWFLELIEVSISYLSNTLSFMRVAGLGIAHVALMIAFMEIAKLLAVNGQFSLGSWVIIVVGNIFVIVLEGLSAGIQSLRLNYYEFFSKYFKGSGEAYLPISLKESS